MPRFRIRLESPDLTRDDGSPHFRVTSGVFDDEDAARAYCERKELQIAAHEYPAAALAELEAEESTAEEGGVRAPAQVRMQLATHRQLRPYGVVDLEEVS
jgi:hypothetical protein